MIEIYPSNEPEIHDHIYRSVSRDVDAYMRMKHGRDLPPHVGFNPEMGNISYLNPPQEKVAEQEITAWIRDMNNDDTAYMSDASGGALHFLVVVRYWDIVYKYWAQYMKQRPRFVPYKEHTYCFTIDTGCIFRIFKLTAEETAEALNNHEANPFSRFLKAVFK